jgi:penicillin-binding protein 1C
MAAHLAERLHRDEPSDLLIETGIDVDLQQGLERIAVLAARQWPPDVSVAILAVENATGLVRGYVGSAGYLDSASFGAIDMVTAIRSPGSTLKPFLYAMAFDARLLHPETVVLDRPMRFGDYLPENFDGGYRGEITAAEALRSSLNVPAVAVLNRIGPGPFLDRLESAGVDMMLPDTSRAPGLAVILGGVGTSLEDLVTLYSGLARGGRVLPLHFEPAVAADSGRSFLSPLGAWYVTRILETVPPPPERLAGATRANAPIIAYKTGTSYGYRDAWAIGYDARYTIGVWVGRPDGSFSSGRMGRDTAAPLLFDAFDLLAPTPGQPVRALPSGPAPAGAILAHSTLDLPVPLQRFGGAASDTAIGEVAGPTINFPLDGGRIALSAGTELRPLALDASGGTLPLLWLVNGESISSQSWKRRASWLPDGPGQARVTVVDRDGRHASVEIWIE